MRASEWSSSVRRGEWWQIYVSFSVSHTLRYKTVALYSWAYMKAATRNVAASDDEWSPPTEAESKVFQARRERQDKISKLLGEYLLKGYKMLGTSCSSCDVRNDLRFVLLVTTSTHYWLYMVSVWYLSTWWHCPILLKFGRFICNVV